MKVFIVVTHLLGAGHLSRALTLGRAFSKAGHHVCVATGGRPAPQFDSTGIDLVQLPSLASDGTNFTRLLTKDGDVADQNYLQSRSDILQSIAMQFAPDVVITELFPFGRRVLASEFLDLLGALKQHPKPSLILGSVRDILAPPSKPAKAQRTEQIVMDHYDAILVHSDPASVTLDVSWPVTDRLATKLQYTGYVAPTHSQTLAATQRSGVLVSAGGGSVGQSLFETALAAARLSPDLAWHLLIGGQDATDRIKALQQSAPANTTLEPTRPDFHQLMSAASCSVSMCGYNTALDVLQSDTPAVFVPFDDGGETEQTLRAQGLAKLPAIRVLTTAQLNANQLLADIRGVTQQSRNIAAQLQFDGAAKSVKIAQSMHMARQ